MKAKRDARKKEEFKWETNGKAAMAKWVSGGGFSCVWARKFISGSSLRGVVTRAVFSSNCYGCFWGP
jgi:hypothetical protein